MLNVKKLTIFLVLLLSSIIFSQHCKVIYHYPLNNAKYVQPVTDIGFRLNDKISDSLFQRIEINVKGTISGNIKGYSKLLGDNTTVIFSPYRKFIEGEKITVEIKSPVLTGVIEINFEIMEHNISHEERKIISQKLLTDFAKADDTTEKGFSKIVRDTPPGFPAINININKRPADGKIFTANFSQDTTKKPYLLILNNDGTPFFYRRMSSFCVDFKLHNNGLMTYFQSGKNKFYVMDSSYTVIDSVQCKNGYQTDAHDIRFLSNGNILLIGTDVQVMDMSKVVPGGNPNANVMGNIIQILDNASNVIFEWRSWDHFQVTDAEHENLTSGFIDYVHANALEIDYDGNILMSSRHLSEITKIDVNTGETIWRLGGKNNQFAFINDTIGFSYQHAILRTKKGTYTLFDNGNFHTPSFSRAVEYSIDENTKTARLIWQFQEDTLFYSPAMGFVERLENGNTTISWGLTNKAFTELDKNGNKIYELYFSPGVFAYRTRRFNLTGIDTPVKDFSPQLFVIAQNYPNPFNNSTIIHFELKEMSNVSLTIFNILGQVVEKILDNESKGPGNFNINFSASGLSTGVYFYQLRVNNNLNTKKMILLK